MNQDKYISIFIRDGYVCQRCGKNQSESRLTIAHRIRKGSNSEKWVYNFVLEKYGKELKTGFIREEILNHPDNLVVACAGACNDSYNVFFKPIARNHLLIVILKKLNIIE